MLIDITAKEWSYLIEVLKQKVIWTFWTALALPSETRTLGLFSVQWHERPRPDSHYNQPRKSGPDTSYPVSPWAGLWRKNDWEKNKQKPSRGKTLTLNAAIRESLCQIKSRTEKSMEDFANFNCMSCSSGGLAWPFVSRSTCVLLLYLCFRIDSSSGLHNCFILSEHIRFPFVHLYLDSCSLASPFPLIHTALLEIAITAAIPLDKK